MKTCPLIGKVRGLILNEVTKCKVIYNHLRWDLAEYTGRREECTGCLFWQLGRRIISKRFEQAAAEA